MLKKKFIITVLLLLTVSCVGCGKKVDIVEHPSESVNQKVVSNVVIATDDCKGKMSFEVVDAYVTTDLASHNVNLNNIDQYMYVSELDSAGNETVVDYPDFISSDKTLMDGCVMYIVKIKATNKDAEYKNKNEFGYDSSYIFRADNIQLNYISDDKKVTVPFTINYFSLRNEDESKWCTFEVKPGELIEYEIGFILGPVVVDNTNQKIYEVDSENMFLSSGPDQYYRIDWK
ncbi:MAG: hypothetical protein ACI4S0_01595 [Dorea sp.]